MLEDLTQCLLGVSRVAVRAITFATAVLLLCGALSIAGSPSPAGGERTTVLNWNVEKCGSGAESGTTQLKFRHDEHRNRVWTARIASLELRLEWGSGHGQESWSVTLFDLEGKQVAHAAATAETDECI